MSTIIIMIIILMDENQRNQLFMVIVKTINLINFSMILNLPMDQVIPKNLDSKIILDDS